MIVRALPEFNGLESKRRISDIPQFANSLLSRTECEAASVTDFVFHFGHFHVGIVTTRAAIRSCGPNVVQSATMQPDPFARRKGQSPNPDLIGVRD